MIRFQVLTGMTLTNDSFIESFKLLPQEDYLNFNNHELILIGIGCYVFNCKNIASALLYCVSNRNLFTVMQKCEHFLPNL